MLTANFFETIQKIQTLAVLTVIITVIVWETVFPFMNFFLGRTKDRIIHAGKNWGLATANLMMQRFLFVGAWLFASVWSKKHGLGLLDQFGIPIWLHGLSAFFILDFWTYWWHRLTHRVPFLWRFHQIHHSDPKMDVTTAYRFHFGEIFISSTLRIPLILFLGLELWEIALFDMLIFVNIQFHHANIGLPGRGDKIFSLFLTSPNMHKVHHSINPKEYNRNFTFFLSIWDRLFGTFWENPVPETIQFGLKDKIDPSDQRLSALLTSPFKRLSLTKKRP